MSISFKDKYPFEKRREEATRIRSKYPDRFPIIVEKVPRSPIPDIDRHKFLVPNDLTIGQFIYVIRKRIKLSPEQALFIFVNNTLPPTSEFVSNIYTKYRDDDGFLYCLIAGESVFGNK